MKEKFKETAPEPVRGHVSTRKQYTLTHVHTHTRSCIHALTHTHTWICTQTYTTLSHSCVCIHTHLHTHAHGHARTHTYTPSHTYIHMYTHAFHVCVHTHSHTILTLMQPETQFQDQLLPLCEHCQLGDLFPNFTMKSPLQNDHHSFCYNSLYTLINF